MSTFNTGDKINFLIRGEIQSGFFAGMDGDKVMASIPVASWTHQGGIVNRQPHIFWLHQSQIVK